MQSNTTQKNITAFFRHGLMLALLFLLTGTAWAQQVYMNGNLRTGTSNAAGTFTAPAGYFVSELQPGNPSPGLSFNWNGNFSAADDFTVPAGQTWNVTQMEFYAYVTGYTSTTVPFDTLFVKIYNTNPSVGTPTPIYGDFTTNRLGTVVSDSTYRLTNPLGTPPTNRLIWRVPANVTTTLTAGTYWVEWSLSGIASVPSHFGPASTVVGTSTQPGNNALQHNFGTTNPGWTAANNATAPAVLPQDFPFKVYYTTTSTCTGPTPTVTVSPSTNLCGPVTLTASGATDYTWTPTAGLSTTTGATVTASPTTTTTYTVTGVTAGCVGTTTVTVNAGPTSAELTGVDPGVIFDQNFDGGLPANWLSVNN
ncbi:MAG: hypothetical protein EOP49_45225, partial [Sphingobacteriales bacterium]